MHFCSRSRGLRVGLALISLIAGLALGTTAVGHAARSSNVVVYRAGGKYGWAGWKAPGWTIQQRQLVDNGTRGEIRLPYIPGNHGISDYRVFVRFAAVVPLTATGDAEVAIRVRRHGNAGYALAAFDCDYTPCLILRKLPFRFPNPYLNRVGADPGNPLMRGGGVLALEVRGKHLYGHRVEEWFNLSLNATDASYRRGGFSSIYIAQPETVRIKAVTITALP